MTIWLPSLSGQGPRYRQLADAIVDAVARGELAPGTKLPPQRRLADALGVTVGTVTRAYTLAEQQGVVTARVGSGTYVRESCSRVSAYGALFDQPRETDLIDLSHATPPPTRRRSQSLARALEAIIHEPAELRAGIDYQPEGGQAWPAQHLADWLMRLGRPVESSNLLMTQGGMHGIHLALSALLAPGERVAAEQLTYPGLVSALSQLSLKGVAVPFDDDGIDVEAAARLHDQCPFRALYVMPDCHNPTTRRLGEARREALVALARRRKFWLIEDDIYPTLSSEASTPLYQLAPECTVTLFSVSKLLGGGLRVGALHAPESVRPRLVAALRAQCWMPPPLMQMVVAHWIASGDADTLLDWQRGELEWRFDRAMTRLAAFHPRGQRGGFYLWLTLPSDLRSSHVVEQLRRRRVIVSSAEAFCLGSVSAPQAIRLCLSAAVSRTALETALDAITDTLGDPAPLLWETV